MPTDTPTPPPPPPEPGVIEDARQKSNDFPELGINTQELIDHIDGWLQRAAAMQEEGENFGPVNWGDLGIADIEYRKSVLYLDNPPLCVVIIEEASPECRLRDWLYRAIDKEKFPNVWVECEW